MFLERHEPISNLAKLGRTGLIRWWSLTANGMMIKPHSIIRFSESVTISYFCSPWGFRTGRPKAIKKTYNFSSCYHISSKVEVYSMFSFILYSVLLFSLSVSRKRYHKKKRAASEMHRTTAPLVHLVINVPWQKPPETGRHGTHRVHWLRLWHGNY